MTRIFVGKKLRPDLERAADYYEDLSGTLALQFLAAIGDAVRLLQRYPAIGSPRYGHSLAVSGLRFLPTETFPYLLIYREHLERIVLLRLLHKARDIETLVDGRRPAAGKAVRRPRNPL